MSIEKDKMIRELHAKHEFSARFIANMPTQNIRVEAEQCLKEWNDSR